MNEHDLSTKVIVQQSGSSDVNMEDLINELAVEEVKRLKRNLTVLDDLELMLMSNVKIQLAMNGIVDNGTLMKIIKTFNTSVDRSNNIIKDKNSSLIQILVDNRTIQEQQQSAEQHKNDDTTLELRSRKKMQSLLSALVAEDDEEVIENDNEQTGDRGTDGQQDS